MATLKLSTSSRTKLVDAGKLEPVVEEPVKLLVRKHVRKASHWETFFKVFPEVFNKKNPKALKIGIFHDLIGLGISGRTARKFLYRYTCRYEYKQLFINGFDNIERIDLCGNTVKNNIPQTKDATDTIESLKNHEILNISFTWTDAAIEKATQ